MVLARSRSRRVQILELYAYLGRYARQPIGDLQTMTVRTLFDLAEIVGEMIQQEKLSVETVT